MTREQVEALALQIEDEADQWKGSTRDYEQSLERLLRVSAIALRSLLAERDALRKAAGELATAARECAARPPQQEPRRAQLMAFVQQWKDRTPEAELGTDYMEGKRFCATELEAYLLEGGDT